MKIELDVHTGDETYLRHVKRKLPVALDDFKPDIVVYNAGIYVLLYLVITSLFILLLYLVIVSGGPQYKFIYVYMYI